MSITTFDELANQLEQSLTEFDSDRSEQPPPESDDDSSPENFAERVRTSVARFADTFESADTFEEVTVAAENLWTVLDEAEDVLDSFDTEAFFETVDTSKLPDAIELSDVPDAVKSGKPRKAIDLAALMEAVDFREFWSSEEIQKIWEESKELSDAVDTLSGDDADDEEDSGLVESTKEKTDMASEITEGKLQSELEGNVEEFREKIDTARDRLQEQIAQSELGSGGKGESATRNITAASTMSENRPDMEVGVEYSAVQGDRPDMDVTIHYSTMPKERREQSEDE